MASNIVKLFSPWHTRDLCFGDIRFSPGVPLEEADAALWEYWPDEAILRYQRPKAWYSWEPRWHSQYRTTLVQFREGIVDGDPNGCTTHTRFLTIGSRTSPIAVRPRSTIKQTGFSNR